MVIRKLLGTKRALGKKLQISNNYFSFGDGIRTEKKIPNYPGPAHGYKVNKKPGFIGVHNRKTSDPKSTKIKMDEAF